jgi:hypothetical protein
MKHLFNKFNTLCFALALVSSFTLYLILFQPLPENNEIPIDSNELKAKNAFELYNHYHPNSILGENIPLNKPFEKDLELIRQTGKLTAENEQIINEYIEKLAFAYQIPPAMVWCLFFQESKLNHMVRNRYSGARGIGQFTRIALKEINKQTNQYYKKSSEYMHALLGQDVRPIKFIRRAPQSLPSSYYNIPTAVVSSGTFYNNRYRHLKSILDYNKIKYNDEILWLLATGAYNKGGRAVISIMNLIKSGPNKLDLLQNMYIKIKTI